MPLSHCSTTHFTHSRARCHRCNRHTGPNLSGIDPGTARPTRPYHPRRDVWEQHFRVDDFQIVGLTASGRATAALLQMNSPVRVELRRWIRGQ